MICSIIFYRINIMAFYRSRLTEVYQSIQKICIQLLERFHGCGVLSGSFRRGLAPMQMYQSERTLQLSVFNSPCCVFGCGHTARTQGAVCRRCRPRLSKLATSSFNCYFDRS